VEAVSASQAFSRLSKGLNDLDCKIYNQDALAFLQGLESKSADLILTDPPYGTTQSSKPYSSLDKALSPEYQALLAFEFARVSDSVFLFAPHQELNVWSSLFQANNFENIRFGVWYKPSAGLNPYPYPSNALEWFIYASNRRSYGRLAPIYTCSPTATLKSREFPHPFRKPIPLLRRIIENHADLGAVVVDPFAGSGNTGVSALLEDCSCLINEKNSDLIDGIEWKIKHYELWQSSRIKEAKMARTKKVWSWSPEQVTALAALMKTHTEMSLNGRPGAAYTESQFIDRVKGRRASEGTEAIKGFYPRIPEEKIWQRCERIKNRVQKDYGVELMYPRKTNAEKLTDGLNGLFGTPTAPKADRRKTKRPVANDRRKKS
jgi:adenine-specific DNA-methyltransferase